MLPLGADENFDHSIVRALRFHRPKLDVVTAQAAGLRGADDRTVLHWAATEGRLLLTHDARTLVGFAYERVARGLAMPGVWLVPAEATVSSVIEELLLYIDAGEAADWDGQVTFVRPR